MGLHGAQVVSTKDGLMLSVALMLGMAIIIGVMQLFQTYKQSDIYIYTYVNNVI